MSKKSAVIHCIVAILVLIISQGVASLWYLLDLKGLELILFGITYVSLTYLLLNLFTRKYSKQPISSFYIPKFHIPGKWILVAFMLPICVLAIMYLLVPGKFYSNDFSSYESYRVIIDALFSIGLAVGIVEEMVFRGIIMHSIESCSGIKWGILLPSFIFGCLHLLNGGLSFSSALLLICGGMLVGIMFSLITYVNRSIWPSMLVHAIWNIFMIGGIITFGATKDSYAISGYLFQTKNSFLTGGEFGVEVSIFAIIGYLSVIAYIWLSQKHLSKK